MDILTSLVCEFGFQHLFWYIIYGLNSINNNNRRKWNIIKLLLINFNVRKRRAPLNLNNVNMYQFLHFYLFDYFFRSFFLY